MENNSSKNLKSKAISGFVWRYAERIGAQGVSFVVSIILARLLAPEVYGTIALITVFTSILSVFIDSGLGNAIIQKKEIDDLDYSTIFYFNVFMSIVIYLLLFFAAPFIAKFYNKEELTLLVRVISITVLIAGVKNIQQAYVARNMIFKKFFFATLGGTLFSAALGIALAYYGAGVWALVAQMLSNSFIDMVILWLTVKWRPKILFSFSRLKTMFSFGSMLLVSGLIDTAYGHLRTLIIGKVYSSSELAFYNKGNSFPSLVINNVNSTIDSVLLPSLSTAQDDKEILKNMTRRAIKTSVYIMAPLLMGLAFCSKQVVTLLLTEKWLGCVPFMAIFCITSVFWPIHTANLNAIKAMGRSDIFLKLEIIKKIVGVFAILITFRISVMAMAYSELFVCLLSQIINSWPNKKLMNYSYLEQLKDIIPSILLAAFMGGCVWCVSLLNLSDLVTLLIQVPLGGIIYIGLSALFKMESFEYCKDTLFSYIKRK